MPNNRKKSTGTIKKLGKNRWEIRITYTDPVTEKRKEITRIAPTQGEAFDLRNELALKIERMKNAAAAGEDGRAVIQSDFSTAAKAYVEWKCRPAVYSGAVRVSGVKSPRTIRGEMETLQKYFGTRPLASITEADLFGFRRWRLAPHKQPDGSERFVTIATCNKELSRLRTFFKWCQKEKLVKGNPFDGADRIIQRQLENKREIVLSHEVEAKLLAALEKGPRRHARGIVIAALDTAMRRGELWRLKWKDVDFDERILRVAPGKTDRGRIVGMTPRLVELLRELQQVTPDDPEGYVFGPVDVKKSLLAACDEAKIARVWFTDFRHTAITRLIASGVNHTEVMKMSGHTQIGTFLRYLNPGTDRFVEAMDNLDRHNVEKGQATGSPKSRDAGKMTK
jgi:integrase